MMAAVLRGKGMHADAYALGKAALDAAPDRLAIATQVRAALSRKVHRFHLPMMLDQARNRAYVDMIERVVRPGMHVLEIGCGSGLLAMVAARAGAFVTTCEANPMVAAAAEAIITRNGFAERIRLIPRHSTELRIPDDLPEPADVVIHEVFGSSLFDEGVDAALSDARKRLLKPGAPALPPRAELRLALQSRTGGPDEADLGNVEGFDLSGFIPILPLRRTLFSSRRSGIVVRSDAVSALTMDFDREPPDGPVKETVALRSHGGRIDGLLQWLAIDTGDLIHDTDPFRDGPDSSWGAPLFDFPRPFDTEPGDIVEVTMQRRGLLVTADAVLRGR